MQEQTIGRQIIYRTDYWHAICKKKKLILWLIAIMAITTTAYSLWLENVYEAQAVITPASNERDNASAGMQAMLSSSGLGNLAAMSGVALPAGAKLNEIEQYLKSTIVREKVLRKHDLLPVLFYKEWDPQKREWKRPGLFKRALNAVAEFTAFGDPSLKRQDEERPSVGDGLRSLDTIINIKANAKENIIAIKVDFHDPVIAADILAFYLETLQDHLRDEKQRVANANKKYLGEQLVKASDPMMRQKIYYLLSRQIETLLMAEVKENSAFMIIDPPTVPDRKIGPKRAAMVLISMFASLFFGVFLAVFLDNLERTKAAQQ